MFPLWSSHMDVYELPLVQVLHLVHQPFIIELPGGEPPAAVPAAEESVAASRAVGVALGGHVKDLPQDGKVGAFFDRNLDGFLRP